MNELYLSVETLQQNWYIKITCQKFRSVNLKCDIFEFHRQMAAPIENIGMQFFETVSRKGEIVFTRHPVESGIQRGSLDTIEIPRRVQFPSWE